MVNNEIIVKDTISIKIDTTVTMPEFYFEVAKANSRTKGTENNGVDAISGATITTQAVGAALNNWFGFYQGYLNQNKTK